ncbi:hypothetical protein P22_0726 [Propionispora sp. 2/2-37]|uniref:TonB-dependent receptor plug domain-containing protein n=1 Tax=Propionispora sp. 2/2-37 TaxID=1677858 RepID=UPI0006BB6DF3|nr:TonB-dependent receptor [Propionispora sp. 2/2-37]CUH94660.1 hypothetical protein P22_0726 [Propionispora sp. 2/2-37]
MRKWKQDILILLAGCWLATPMTAAAGQEEQPEFRLEAVNVTALRYEATDLETPADISVYTQEQLKRTGANTLVDALKFTNGLMYQSMGPYGQANGSMTSKLAIRGVEKGTLVLLNGVPINLNGYYYLDQIQLDQVERVEILKGSGSVLYGSEAFGGVINIITKKTVQNSVRFSPGSEGPVYGITLQQDKLSMIYDYSRPKDTGIIAPKTLTGYGDSEKDNLSLGYRLNDHVNINYLYSRTDYPLYKKNTDRTTKEIRDYTDTKHFLQLEYKEGDWLNKLFWNHQTLDNEKTAYKYPSGGVKATITNESSKNDVWGLSTQKNWNHHGANWVSGLDIQYEAYESSKAMTDHSRNHYSAFLQWDKNLTDKTKVILGAREDLVHTDDGQHIDAFSPQLQTVTKITDNSSWYTNIGKSFRMPTFTQLYKDKESDFVSNPDLKPETGYNYEIGYKKQYNSSQVKVALFHVDISDQIDWKAIGGGKSQAQNMAGFRNTGIEVSYDKKAGEHVSYSLGCSYGNPKQQATAEDPWIRTMGRIQLTGSVNYQNGPVTTALSAMYYGDRIAEDDSGTPVSRKAMLPVNLHIGYELAKHQTLTFDVDNLLNRKDITTNGSSEYYAMERSYKLGYIYRF